VFQGPGIGGASLPGSEGSQKPLTRLGVARENQHQRKPCSAGPRGILRAENTTEVVTGTSVGKREGGEAGKTSPGGLEGSKGESPTLATGKFRLKAGGGAGRVF